MHLNSLSPALGSKPAVKRVGRGIGSGFGKTCGRGHKGQKSRNGGSVKPGFEGGQMPLQRRVPKYGFTSRKSLVTSEVRLSELNTLSDELIDLDTLKKNNVIRNDKLFVKIILSGEITRAITVKGLRVSRGAKLAIESAGGKVEE